MRKVIKEAVAINDEIILTPGDEIDVIKEAEAEDDTDQLEESEASSEEADEASSEEEFEDRVEKVKE